VVSKILYLRQRYHFGPGRITAYLTRFHQVSVARSSVHRILVRHGLEERDIRHVYIRPRTPHLNGKVERSHRVDDQEFYQLLDKDGIADDIHLFNDKLREWEDHYNYHRPHGALDGQTPYERLMQKATASLSPSS
jgi:transposase InsO family protein